MTTTDHPADTFDLTVFDQTRTWTDRDGETYDLADLAADSRANLVVWLRRHARHFYLQVLTRELAAGADARAGMVPDLVFQSADEWLSGTPLLRELAVPGGAGD